MKRMVKQFRYYGPGHPDNSTDPVMPDHKNLLSGSLFASYMPIIQLGVQGLPGTELYLNNSRDSVVIGSTGIYELDLQGLAEITSLSFDNDTLNLIDEEQGQNFLLVDIIYEQKEDE